MSHVLSRLFDLAALVLERTGAAARLTALPLFPAALPLEGRVAWSFAAITAAVLLLYAALAAGSDRSVRAFRVVTLLAACLLPLLAARLVPAGSSRPFGGGVLAALLVAGFVHRALTRAPLDAARGAIVGAGTLLWLWLCLGEPSVEASMRVLPGLYAAETLAGFLFGAAARGRR